MQPDETKCAECARLREQLDAIAAIIERADSVKRKGRSLPDWLAQVLQHLVVDASNAPLLAKALTASQVRGLLSLAPLALRDAVGNTNVACIQLRVDQAAEALAATTEGTRE